MAFLAPSGAIRPTGAISSPQSKSTYQRPNPQGALKGKVLARRQKPTSTAQKNANTLGQVISGSK
jgi:hypothetical protein